MSTNPRTATAAAPAYMDKWEKSIREKVFAANILTEAEWVYLVGLFGMARDHSDCDPDAQKNMLATLRSIAANTCCGTCQEAAKWARAAIAQATGADPAHDATPQTVA